MEAHEVKALMAQLAQAGEQTSKEQQETAQRRFDLGFKEIFGEQKK